MKYFSCAGHSAQDEDEWLTADEMRIRRIKTKNQEGWDMLASCLNLCIAMRSRQSHALECDCRTCTALKEYMDSL